MKKQFVSIFCLFMIVNSCAQNSEMKLFMREIDVLEIDLYKECAIDFETPLYICNFNNVVYSPYLQDTIITVWECKISFNKNPDSCVVSNIRFVTSTKDFRISDLPIIFTDILLYKLQHSDLFYVKHSDRDLKIPIFINFPLKLMPSKSKSPNSDIKD